MAHPVDPTSLVFRKVADKASHVVFYTNPAKVNPSPPADAILQHYHQRLNEIGAKPWLWIFDGANFDTDHIMELRTGQGIAELLQGPAGQTLREIVVINPTVHLKVLLKVIQPFIADAVLAKLSVKDDRVRSVLEYM
jgi:hypothetical protein